MDAAECQRSKACCIQVWIRTSHLPRFHVRPTVQSHLFIEEQIPFGLALADQKSSGIPTSLLVKRTDVHIAKDIHIMDEDRAIRIKERQCFLDATTRFQQAFPFIRDTDIHSEVLILFEVIDNLLCKMVDVDDDPFKTRCLQIEHNTLEQRLAPYPPQCFRHGVGKRLQARAQSGSKDHRLFDTLMIYHLCILLRLQRYYLISIPTNFTTFIKTTVLLISVVEVNLHALSLVDHALPVAVHHLNFKTT